MILPSVIIGLVLLLIVLSPFWRGPGGRLAEASSISSTARLIAVREALLKRYLEDEKAYADQQISKRAWQTRQQFLVNRYVDATRRLDYLQYSKREGVKRA